MSDHTDTTPGSTLSRRDFVALSVAAGVALGTGAHAATVQEHEVEIKTPDGSADAVLLAPGEGRHPGVIWWSDAFGLRPVMRDMARRLAAEGYAVLVPNPYYRNGHAPQPATKLDFANTDDRAKLMALMGSLTPEAVGRDALAYGAFLDGHASVDAAKKLGVHGYCMGGRLSFRTAAALPDRIGALGSFHGGGLVTEGPDSPHLLIPKLHAQFYIGVAADDDAKEPQAKDTLRKAFDSAKLNAQIDVYADTLHGWCVRDMQPREGKPIYNEAAAERAWAKLLELYRTALA
jgi:carboxymethylenebutenolidase